MHAACADGTRCAQHACAACVMPHNSIYGVQRARSLREQHTLRAAMHAACAAHDTLHAAHNLRTRHTWRAQHAHSMRVQDLPRVCSTHRIASYPSFMHVLRREPEPNPRASRWISVIPTASMSCCFHFYRYAISFVDMLRRTWQVQMPVCRSHAPLGCKDDRNGESR